MKLKNQGKIWVNPKKFITLPQLTFIDTAFY